MNINGKLRQFNEWRDDFLVELSTLLLMIGFIMGTVDLLTRGGMAINGLFSFLWAVVQAVSIDGLFFAVWGKVSQYKWQHGIWKGLSMIFVGIILSLVATIINGILAYQQIKGIPDSFKAMAQLGIDPYTFTWIRAGLVVSVALLVQLFCRGKGETPDTSHKSISPHRRANRSITRSVQASQTVTVMQEESITPDDQVSEERITPEPQVSEERITTESHLIPEQTLDTRERIKEKYQWLLSAGSFKDYEQLARETQVSIPTVKRYMPGIKKEMKG
jgi:hypothetical protein